ncbi:peptidoglycan recognition protein 1-like [Hyperolius riggenbachi]|uniref:peptidoglycan recognition protein 1-like n=1 Tax=Hyperolius riggenbachi TaxID=752182 RepID=UPI0035A35126
MILFLVILSVLCTTLNALEIVCTPAVIARDGWGFGTEEPTCGKPLIGAASKVIIHQTGGNSCPETSCDTILQGIRDSHMAERNLKDIAYNFLIDDNGNVYEGRGWVTLGYYAKYYDKGVISIAFIGNFKDTAPLKAAQDAARNLIACGKANLVIAENADLEGFQDPETVKPDSELGKAITAELIVTP